MKIFKRNLQPAPVAELPAPLPLATLAGRAQLGGIGGSGSTETWTALQPSYTNGHALTQDVGHHQLVSDAAQLPARTPDSLLVDRPLFGGVRTESEFGGFQDEVMIGGYVMLANRGALVQLVAERMAPQSDAIPAVWRDAPPVVSLCRRGAANLPTGLAGSAI